MKDVRRGRETARTLQLPLAIEERVGNLDRRSRKETRARWQASSSKRQDKLEATRHAMIRRELPQGVVARRAFVYIRQSTGMQVSESRESTPPVRARGPARDYGFCEISVIDDDLGVSASGTMDRPGLRNLGVVGAVFCLEASRLARNGRDWHHLMERCALLDVRVIGADSAYDPTSPNDQRLLGLKRTMSEFELTTLRRRLLEAEQAKARRGELRRPVPVGYVGRETLA